MKNTLSIPHDIEAEQAVLGSIIEDNTLLNKLTGILEPESFFKPSHQHIFRVIIEIIAKQLPVDEVIIGDALKSNEELDESGGYAYLAELIECAPSVGNIVYYARIIQEHAILRKLIIVSADINRRARDPQENVSNLISEYHQEIIKLSNLGSFNNGTKHIKDVIIDLFKDWEEKTDNPEKLPGISTGFEDLDNFTGGLIPPALWIIAARPKMGKTALAMNIVENVNINKDRSGATLIFSLEMSEKQLANRLLTSNARVDNKKVKFGNIENEDWDRLTRATGLISGTQIYINRGARKINEIEAEARRLDSEFEDGVSLIVVDYLQLMKGTKNNQNREQEISEITRVLKGLAVELNVPVIALSQLNRKLEDRKDKRPVLSDLRESGAIEQDADIILFIYRDEIYDEESKDKGIAEIIIGGHREGPTGTIKMDFKGEFTKFTDRQRVVYGV